MAIVPIQDIYNIDNQTKEKKQGSMANQIKIIFHLAVIETVQITIHRVIGT